MATPIGKNPFAQGAYNPGSVTIVDWEYWDTLTVNHANPQTTLFSDRTGQNSKTLADTNMTGQGGALPTGQWMQVWALRVFGYWKGSAQNAVPYSLVSQEAQDVLNLIATTTVDVGIANLATQGQWTLQSLMGISLTGTVLPAATFFANPAIQGPRWHGIYPLNNPITLPEQTGFTVTLIHQDMSATSWANTHTINGSLIRIGLVGKLARMGA